MSFRFLNHQLGCPKIYLLAINAKESGLSNDLCSTEREVRLSGVKCSIILVHIRKSYKMFQTIVRFRFLFRIAKRCIVITFQCSEKVMSDDASTRNDLQKVFESL